MIISIIGVVLSFTIGAVFGRRYEQTLVTKAIADTKYLSAVVGSAKAALAERLPYLKKAIG